MSLLSMTFCRCRTSLSVNLLACVASSTRNEQTLSATGAGPLCRNRDRCDHQIYAGLGHPSHFARAARACPVLRMSISRVCTQEVPAIANSIPAPVIAARADPNEILFRASIVTPVECLPNAIFGRGLGRPQRRTRRPGYTRSSVTTVSIQHRPPDTGSPLLGMMWLGCTPLPVHH